MKIMEDRILEYTKYKMFIKKHLRLNLLLPQCRLCSFDSELKTKVLGFALQNVIRDGWSDDAISNGAIEAGLPGLSYRIVSPADLVYFFLDKKKSFVDELMSKHSPNIELSGIDRYGLQNCMLAHLEYIAPYRLTWPDAVGIISGPQYIHQTKQTIEHLSHAFYRAALPTTSPSSYSCVEQGMLLSVYSTAELYMLTDTSEDLAETRDYLDRAITAYCHNRDPSNSVAKTATIFASQMLGQWFTSRQ